jgi:hypothetical protein
MKNRWMLAVVAAVLLVGMPAAHAAGATPSHVVVDVSVVPVSEAPRMVVVPGDRTDKPAYVAEIAVRGPSEEAAMFAHKWFVVFPGEPASGTFSSSGLSIEYRVAVDEKEPRADAGVRVTARGKFIGGSHCRFALTASTAGVKQAPRK